MYERSRLWNSKSFSWVILFSFISTGCSPEPTNYSENLLAKFRAEQQLGINLQTAQDFIKSSLEREFGKIDTPKLPESISSNPQYQNLIDMSGVKRSAGPVGRDTRQIEFGLYRKHCAVCHGVNGDGYGPAALTLAPYPRDFRRGTFKFHTQGQGRAPSHQDLANIIAEGIPGTAMPSMANLQADQHFQKDIEDLAHYVQFLSMRGEFERLLWLDIIPDFNELDFSQPAPQELRLRIDKAIRSVADRWNQSKQSNQILAPQSRELAFDWPDDLLETDKRDKMLASAVRGRELFRSEVTACAQCHGENADGEGRLKDFDEWTKDWTIRAGIDPNDRQQWSPLKKLGLLKPVADKPRNLNAGVFRGGESPELIFHRLAHGIDGTPMPAAPRIAATPVGLTDDQIWDLVNYCQSLAYPQMERQP